MDNNDYFLQLSHYLFKKIVLILVFVLIGIVIAFAFTNLFIDDEYEAKSVMLLKKSDTTFGYQNTSEREVYFQMIFDCELIIKSRDFYNDIITDNNISNCEYDEYVESIEVEYFVEKNIFNILYTHTDKNLATNVVNLISEKLVTEVEDTLLLAELISINEATVPEEPSSPNMLLNVVVGGIIGFFIAFIFLSINYQFGNRVNSIKNIELSGFSVILDSHSKSFGWLRAFIKENSSKENEIPSSYILASKKINKLIDKSNIIIAVTSPGEDYNKSIFAYILAKIYALSGNKTLLFNFDRDMDYMIDNNCNFIQLEDLEYPKEDFISCDIKDEDIELSDFSDEYNVIIVNAREISSNDTSLEIFKQADYNIIVVTEEVTKRCEIVDIDTILNSQKNETGIVYFK